MGQFDRRARTRTVIATSSDLFLFFWLASAGVGGVIGASKGRPLAGAVWGLLLGPLGWILVGAGPDRRPKCPECRGDVVPGANRCKNCGHILNAPPPAEAAPCQTTPNDDQPASLSSCPGCSGVMVNGVCSLCGFEEPPHLAAKAEPPKISVEPSLVRGAS